MSEFHVGNKLPSNDIPSHRCHAILAMVAFGADAATPQQSELGCGHRGSARLKEARAEYDRKR
jgi:hypothetical protein